MKIIALDPGVTTGFTTYQDEVDGQKIAPQWAQWQSMSEVKAIWEQLVSHEPDVVVYEKFTSPSATRHRVELFPVQVIGVTRLYCQRAEVPEFSHTASMGKGFWNDKKIKKCGLWVPSMGHAMDATRHLLYHLTITMKDNTWLNMTR